MFLFWDIINACKNLKFHTQLKGQISTKCIHLVEKETIFTDSESDACWKDLTVIEMSYTCIHKTALCHSDLIYFICLVKLLEYMVIYENVNTLYTSMTCSKPRRITACFKGNISFIVLCSSDYFLQYFVITCIYIILS